MSHLPAGVAHGGAMALQFVVLASGSRGNAALVRAGGPSLMIDLGLGPRTIHARLAEVGPSWDAIAGVLLTHTHGDHVGPNALRWAARRKLTLHCHESHRTSLER